MSVATRCERIRKAIDECCEQAGRQPGDVRLVAVSKTVDVDRVAEAVAAGVIDFGENRPDELARKHEAFPEARWHFIGNIQSRKIAEIVPCADLIHSVFQEHHLPRIDRVAAECGKVQEILIEVNVLGEGSKSGLKPDDVPAMIEAASAYPHIKVRGLMTMAPRGDASAVDDCFAGLAALRDRLMALDCVSSGRVSLDELSMGMSEDWQSAIMQGATMVRIGRAVFSDGFE